VFKTEKKGEDKNDWEGVIVEFTVVTVKNHI
jgi:hypothetical protein